MAGLSLLTDFHIVVSFANYACTYIDTLVSVLVSVSACGGGFTFKTLVWYKEKLLNIFGHPIFALLSCQVLGDSSPFEANLIHLRAIYV